MSRHMLLTRSLRDSFVKQVVVHLKKPVATKTHPRHSVYVKILIPSAPNTFSGGMKRPLKPAQNTLSEGSWSTRVYYYIYNSLGVCGICDVFAEFAKLEQFFVQNEQVQ